jgi:hypothetical protein
VNLTSGASAILEAVEFRVTAPGFGERLEVAAHGGKPGRGARSIAAPVYVSDLGIRRHDDPRLFFDAHMQLLAFPAGPTPPQVVDEMLGADIPDLAGLLDACILLTGDYDSAVKVIGDRLGEISASRVFALQLYAGVILAACGDPRCRKLFIAAASTARAHAGANAMALHRLAAAEIKRFRQPARGVEILDGIDAQLELTNEREGEFSSADRETLMSLTGNLRALALLQLGDASGAASEVARARDRVQLDGLSSVDRSEAARYASQETINVAQVLVARGAVTDAIALLDENIRFCRANCPEYVGEALSVAAYAGYLADDFASSRVMAEGAIAELVHQATPTRLRVAREVLMATLVGLEDPDSARAVFQSIQDDPLGLEVLGAATSGHSPE